MPPAVPYRSRRPGQQSWGLRIRDGDWGAVTVNARLNLTSIPSQMAASKIKIMDARAWSAVAGAECAED